MSDDNNNRGPADAARVNVHEEYEVRYWTAKWGCTAAELEAAVKAVGVMAQDVEVFLTRDRSRSR